MGLQSVRDKTQYCGEVRKESLLILFEPRTTYNSIYTLGTFTYQRIIQISPKYYYCSFVDEAREIQQLFNYNLV